MITVYSLYHGFDHRGETVHVHLGTFCTKEQAIARGTEMSTEIKPDDEIYCVEHILGELYPRGTDDIDPVDIIEIITKDD